MIYNRKFCKIGTILQSWSNGIRSDSEPIICFFPLLYKVNQRFQKTSWWTVLRVLQNDDLKTQEGDEKTKIISSIATPHDDLPNNNHLTTATNILFWPFFLAEQSTRENICLVNWLLFTKLAMLSIVVITAV